MKRVKKWLGFLFISMVCTAMIVPFASAKGTAKESKAKTAPTEVSLLKLEAEDCNVRLGISHSKHIEYDYDKSKFEVSTNIKASTTTITAKKKAGAESAGLLDMIVINIPKNKYDTVSVHSNQAGVSLPEMNVNFDLYSKKGALSVPVPLGYNKTLKYTLISGAGSIDFKQKAKDFKVSLDAEQSAVSVPKTWGTFHSGSTYKYTNGTGAGEFILQLKKSSLSITNARK
ncbi:hypothetical protein DCC85_21815 [Paenibacillus sp. CAA11]|uniref:hypothetical protein n=1 Tax=Paenibacillus sp. CAA11 TaxID=1532905 RepID=UPI000D335216|nr:hypothetical protein [Paenibacillus sp. CAA11]AWB46544.1 hypothetical protein DCC85_21815 [Paenibacillus sp. CAA11]